MSDNPKKNSQRRSVMFSNTTNKLLSGFVKQEIATPKIKNSSKQQPVQNAAPSLENMFSFDDFIKFKEEAYKEIKDAGEKYDDKFAYIQNTLDERIIGANKAIKILNEKVEGYHDLFNRVNLNEQKISELQKYKQRPKKTLSHLNLM